MVEKKKVIKKKVIKKKATKKIVKKAPVEKAAAAPPEQVKKRGSEVVASRASKGTRIKSTPAGRALDSKIAAILEKAKHPLKYPIQISKPDNTIHTGLYMLDLILCGGYRKGRMHTILGKESAGKSSIIQEGIAAAMRQGIRIFHFEPEKTAMEDYMQRQGIQTEGYLMPDGSQGYYYIDPKTGEDFYKISGQMLDALPADLDPNTPPKVAIFLDSYESFESETVTDEQAPIGAYARMHSQKQKMFRGRLKRAGGTLIATNQVRTSGIGSYFVNPEDDAGGYALRYYADIRLFVKASKIGGTKSEPCPPNTCNISMITKKSRTCAPMKEIKGNRLIIGRGFDRLWDRLQYLITIGEIKYDKGKYTMIDKSVKGRIAARRMMKRRDYREFCDLYRGKLSTYERYFDTKSLVAESWDDEEDDEG